MLENIPLVATVPPGHVEYERLIKAFKNIMEDHEVDFKASQSEDLAEICERELGQPIPFEKTIKETEIEELDAEMVFGELVVLRQKLRIRRMAPKTPPKVCGMLARREIELQNAESLVWRWRRGLTFDLQPFSEMPIRFQCRALEVYANEAVVRRQAFFPMYLGQWTSSISSLETIRLHRLHLSPAANNLRWASLREAS